MNKCDYCNVYVDSHHKKCPLCHGDVIIDRETLEPSFTEFPSYKKKYRSIQKTISKKVLLFMLIAGSLICLLINLLTLSDSVNLWSLVVVASCILTFSFYKITTAKTLNIGGRLIWFYYFIGSFLFLIDFLYGFHMWSTTYVIPFMSIGMTLALAIISSTSKVRYKTYLSYIIISSLLGLVPMIFFLFSLTRVVWTSIVSASFSVIVVLGFLIFSDKEFKHELKKMFHI